MGRATDFQAAHRRQMPGTPQREARGPIARPGVRAGDRAAAVADARAAAAAAGAGEERETAVEPARLLRGARVLRGVRGARVLRGKAGPGGAPRGSVPRGRAPRAIGTAASNGAANALDSPARPVADGHNLTAATVGVPRDPAHRAEVRMRWIAMSSAHNRPRHRPPSVPWKSLRRIERRQRTGAGPSGSARRPPP